MDLPTARCDATAEFDRRSLLKFVGAGIGLAVAHGILGPLAVAEIPGTKSGGPWVGPDGIPAWKSPQYPIPLPGDGGDASTDPKRFAQYEVKDALVLPEGFAMGIVARWGDVFGSGADTVRFGANCDFTAMVPVPGKSGEYWLLVNHEYISGRPFLQGYAEVVGPGLPRLRLVKGGEGKQLVDWVDIDGRIVKFYEVDVESRELENRLDVQAKVKRLCDAAMDELGVTILHVRLTPDGAVEVIKNSPNHRRIMGTRTVNAPWPIPLTGPARLLVNQSPGTFSNCSGGVTPWETVLTCEENFQDQVNEELTANGENLEKSNPPLRPVDYHELLQLPLEFEGLGHATSEPMDGRSYGWVGEIDPESGKMVKHTMLGRFRHENVAVRCIAGHRLAAYMGDDRRGGHVWKFVSKSVVTNERAKTNSQLFEDGTLYVARLAEDFTGQWIPLEPETKLVMPEPETCATGHIWLPSRPAGGRVMVSLERRGACYKMLQRWVRDIENFSGKRFDEMTLGDLVVGESREAKLAVILADAYVMANCVGGTPAARPEDVEVHPIDGSVYVAFTDSTGSDDGSPDMRIFPDSKKENSRQYGAIYRLEESENNPGSLSFKWGKFVSSGETADGGGGFACADNLAFDPAGNLWMVCDITTKAINFPVLRDDPKTKPGETAFMGVFGNNAMFMIPTSGPEKGIPKLFAIAPMEAELCGPTFVNGGRTLILSVQHPGEVHGTRGRILGSATEQVRTVRIAGRDGRIIEQTRTVPLGSNFPSQKLGETPRASVVWIRRT